MSVMNGIMKRRLVGLILTAVLIVNFYLIHKRFMTTTVVAIPEQSMETTFQVHGTSQELVPLIPSPISPARTNESANLKTFFIPQGDKNITFTIFKKNLPFLTDRDIVFNSYKEALQAKVSPQNVVYIALLDQGFVDMAVNLWETSLAPLHINNFLFVCSTKNAYNALHYIGIPAYLYTDKGNWVGKASEYGSSTFKEKTHLKSKLVLEALEFGFNVILTDPDIVYLKDPMQHFPCSDCDLQIQSDSVMINSGFYLIRNTSAGKMLEKRAYETGLRNKGVTNQGAFQQVLNQMKKSNSIKSVTLNSKLFPNGKVYWEDAHRMLPTDSPTDTPVIIHNNWMQSMPPKIYRAMEFGMWLTDRDGYYSNPDRKYLVYGNVFDYGSVAQEKELNALRSALAIGHLLNRTVILPIFRCKCKRIRNTPGPCLLLNMYYIGNFDKYFAGHYREHIFLEHPKVPSAVKTSQSEVLLIDTDATKVLHHLVGDDVKHFIPKQPSQGASKEEIINWFKLYEQVSVLRFHSLFDAVQMPLYGSDSEFDQSLQKAFKKSEYRQY